MVTKTKTQDRSTQEPYFYAVHNIVYQDNPVGSGKNFAYKDIGTYAPTRYGPYPFQEDIRSRTWQTTPNWKATKDALGYLPTLNYTDEHLQIFRAKGNFMSKHAASGLWPGTEDYGNMHWSIQPSSHIDNSLGNRVAEEAKIACLMKAKDMKANIPVFLAEARKSADMIAETATKVYRSYRNFRKGRWKQAARDLGIAGPKGPSNNWLSYKYGWLPLLNDAKGIAELAIQHLNGRPLRMTVKDTKRVTTRHNVLLGNGITGYSHGSNRNMGTVLYTAKAGLLLQLSCGALAGLGQIGIADPALFLWDVIPFSFVFDWFISIGTLLAAQTALLGLTVLAGYSSVTSYVHGRSHYVNTRTESFAGSIAPARYEYRRYVRSPWMGEVSLNSIGYVNRDPLGITKFITLMALFRQRSR